MAVQSHPAVPDGPETAAIGQPFAIPGISLGSLRVMEVRLAAKPIEVEIKISKAVLIVGKPPLKVRMAGLLRKSWAAVQAFSVALGFAQGVKWLVGLFRIQTSKGATAAV